MSGAEEQAHAGRVHDALLHGKTLLVVAARDLEDVALVFGTQTVTGNLLSHAVVHEGAQSTLVFDLDQLLRAISRVGYVELHLDRCLLGKGDNVKMMMVSR